MNKKASKRKRTFVPAKSIDELVQHQPGKNGPPSKLTKEMLAKLETCCKMACSIGVMAPMLGVEAATISRWRTQDPRLKMQMEQWRATGLHTVNRKLWEHALQGERWAIEFILRTLHPDYRRNSFFEGRVPNGDMGAPDAELDFSYL